MQHLSRQIECRSTTGEDDHGRAGEDRRDANRIRTVYRIARIRARGDEGLARIRNISDSGMKLTIGMPLLLGDTVTVELSDTLEVTGRVIWTDGKDCGLQFVRALNSVQALRETAEQIMSGEQRAPRLPAGLSAVVTSERGVRSTRVCDISQRGMKIVHDGGFTPGLAVKVGLGSGMERRGFVRWVRDGVAGVILTEHFSVDDLGSVSAL